MKNMSLKEQRQALLDHMDASRTGYRRMLADPPAKQRKKRPTSPTGFGDEPTVVVTTHAGVPPVATARLTDPSHDFPRSMTVRLLMKHPYVSVSAAAGLLALIGPRRVGKIFANPRLVTAATAVGGMIMRQQPMLRKYGKMFSMGAGFLQAQQVRKRR